MTTQLIPVFEGTISNEPTLLVNARDLHGFLEVGKDFSNWIRARLNEYGFVENLDYILFSQIWRKLQAAAARITTSPSTQPKNWRWLSVTKKAARSADTSSSAKRNFARAFYLHQ